MSTYALLMAKAMRKYFRENFDGAETANISPSKVSYATSYKFPPRKVGAYYLVAVQN